MEDVVEEAKKLVEFGAKEIILISQDSIRYGLDLYGKPSLLDLLKALEEVEGAKFRVLYLYPDLLSFEFLKQMA